MLNSRTFFLLVLILAPVQFSKFFFIKESYVLGIPIDYRAISIYALDLVVLAFIAFFIFENFKKFKKILTTQKNFGLSLLVFNLYLLLTSAFFSPDKTSSLFFSVKILEFSAFAFFASILLENQKLFSKITAVLSLGILWQALVVFWQFASQKSAGLWFLGERSFDTSTVSIAHVDFFGRQLLRAYGTFPHPNVAAAFFVIFQISMLHFSQKAKSPNKSKIPTLGFLASAASFPATLLTFSKTAITAFFITFFSNQKRKKEIILLTTFLVVAGLSKIKSLPQAQIPTIAERLVLIQASLDITAKNPFFGTGAANFIPELSKLNLFSISEVRLLQPVHNIFLLILAENGIVGLLLFAAVVISAGRNLKGQKSVLFLVILIFATVDHFLWTLEQGRLLFFLSLAIISSQPKKVKPA